MLATIVVLAAAHLKELFFLVSTRFFSTALFFFSCVVCMVVCSHMNSLVVRLLKKFVDKLCFHCCEVLLLVISSFHHLAQETSCTILHFGVNDMKVKDVHPFLMYCLDVASALHS